MNPLPAPDPARVVAYVRTSSVEQGKAFGPDVQRRAINAYAKAAGLEIVAWFHEDISGTVRADDRPVMQEAVAAAFQHGAPALLVAERSRLARDEFVAHDALRSLRGVGLDVVYADGGNGTDDSALLLDGIGHVIAAHDRRRIVARLKAGRDAKAAQLPHDRAQGGRLPHGYVRDRDGLVTIDPVAAEQVRQCFAMARDRRSVRQIANAVDLAPSVVDRILKREIYKQREPGRIVDPRVWNATQDALAARRRA